MELVDKSVRDVLAAFSAPDPTPGGGSASALAAAVGASLLMMVASMPKSRTGSDEERDALRRSATRLTAVRQRLTEAIDADAAAYDEVVAAYRLPKASDADKAARTAAIQRALRTAADVPLEVMRLSAEAMADARLVAANGHRGASSDIGVAVALLRAGLHGARLNVEINVSSIRDDAYTTAVRTEVNRLEQEGVGSAEAAERALTTE